MRFNTHFMDTLRMTVKGGPGGMGQPKYGGIGGKGGDVIIKCKKEQTLERTKKMVTKKKAGVGEDSRKFKLIGDHGKNLTIPVPPGTVVNNEFGNQLGELNTPDETFIVARGGSGGYAVNQYFGQQGEIRHIRLLLKLIADVGLVGFPNAGKSTLLKAVSRAKPKIASYPFTTLRPTVGAVFYDDGRQISVADLPGLIEGSWANYGRGHEFLRHVERTKLLLFVIDIHGFQLGPKYPKRSAIENLILLNKELEIYQPDLILKPSALILNKMDLPDASQKCDEFMDQLENIADVAESMEEEMRPRDYLKFRNIIPCSLKYKHTSVEEVKKCIRDAMDYYEDLKYDESNALEIAKEEIHSSISTHSPTVT